MLLYNKAKWSSLKDQCKDISTKIVELYEADNLDPSLFDHFSKSLDSAVDDNIPSKHVTNRNNYPWMNNKDLKRMIRVKSAKIEGKGQSHRRLGTYKQHQKECKKAL